MGKAIGINLQQACATAWAVCWARHLANREKCLKSRFKYGLAETYYLTGTDLERQIREAVAEAARAAGHSGYGIRISTGHRGGLLDVVRRWLSTQASAGVLEVHNFGRGHISGARYRPAGAPMAPAEVKTVHRNEVRRSRANPVHAAASEQSALLLCQQPKHGGGGWRRRAPIGRKPAEYGKVTCPRCLRMIKEGVMEVDYGVRLKWMGTWRLWSFRMRLCGAALPDAEVRKLITARHPDGKLIGWRRKATTTDVGRFDSPREAAAEAVRVWPWLKVDLEAMNWSLKDDERESLKDSTYAFSDALQTWEQETGIRLSKQEGKWTPQLEWRSK